MLLSRKITFFNFNDQPKEPSLSIELRIDLSLAKKVIKLNFFISELVY